MVNIIIILQNMHHKLQRILILLLGLLCPGQGVAPITNNHQKTTNNERQKENTHVLYGLNIVNNTSEDKGPSFDFESTSTNITVLAGEDAYLVCLVMNLGRNYVSWIRHKDINLISVGLSIYTQEKRYDVFHNGPNNDTWTLKIRRVRTEDEGVFECQISSAQPVGHLIYLKVIDPEVSILGDDENRFAVAGSNLNLTCYIRQTSNERKILNWTHNEQEINHHSRGGVFIITEHNVVTVSHLVIKNLTMADSGQYSCSASAESSANVTLHVIHDHSVEAVTFNESIKISSTFYILFSYFFVTFIT